MRSGIIAIAAAVSLSGCVGTLETQPHRFRTATVGEALKGVSYSLPKVQYEVKLTRWLAECPNDYVGGKTTALKFGVRVEAKPRYVAGEAYEINYEKLSGLFRTSNFEIKYWPNGTLKSIGAAAEDKTADAIKDGVKTGLAVASVAAGSPPIKFFSTREPASAAEEVLDGVICTSEAFRNVQALRKANEDATAAAKEVTKLTKEMERFRDRAALKLVNRSDRERLLEVYKELDIQEAAVRNSKKTVADLEQKLGVVDEFIWDSDLDRPQNGQTAAYVLSEAQLAKLAGLIALGDLRPSRGDEQDGERRASFAKCYPGEPSINECVGQQLNLRSLAKIETALPVCDPNSVDGSIECMQTVASTEKRVRAARDNRADHGIFVREPARGRLLFCRYVEPSCTEKLDLANLDAASFPQLGQLRYLPLRVHTFQSKEMALSMTEDGRVESFSYKSTKAPGAVLAATAADIATQIDTALEKRETELRDDRKYAREQETAEVESEIKRLTKELELKKARDAFVEDPLKPIRDETAQVQAELALLQARKAKLEAEKALAPQP